MKLIISETIDGLNAQVVKEVSRGWDLYGGLIAAKFEIGQWMINMVPLAKYRLVQAPSLRRLEQECTKLIEDGWEFYMYTTEWHGFQCQWMSRSEDHDASRMQIITAESFQEPATVLDGATLVESAQPILRLLPVAVRKDYCAGFEVPVIVGPNGVPLVAPGRSETS